jgi:eukaryotic-like serine/threonine-protein kinase
MDPARWDRIQTLFHEALALPPDERKAWVGRAAAGDPELEEDVLALLEEDARDSSLLDDGVAGLAEKVLGTAAPIPERVGPYRILRILGEGGMGVVYLAERPDLGNRVALKMLRDAWLSPVRRDRFAGEQRTLARLDHPSIARLYDADALPDGTPYFVMEYVEGLPITRYCREAGASLEERLQLFREVCEAVRHAHGMAVIHRDLKPSNVLVTRDGAVKLLDFGIAHQLESVDAPADPTRTGLRLMTPSYAAPEQLMGEPPGVYTDIYALGVVLYELLTGRRPYDLAGLTPGQAERRVLEEEPARPSSLVAGRGRRGSWADLDVLCLTAMHKDPARRYPTVEALVRDLDRYFRHEPLEARGDSLGYRVGKYLRRNRRGVALSGAAAAVMVGLAGFHAARLAEERSRAQAEATKASEVSEYLIRLFEAGDPFGPGGDAPEIPDLLERGVARAEALSGQPETQAQLFHVLGRVHTSLSDFERAEELLQRALALRRAVAGPERRVLPRLGGDPGPALETAETLQQLGVTHRYRGDLQAAETAMREALAIRETRLPAGHPDLATSMDELGVVLSNQGRYPEAEALYRRALAVREEAYGGPHLLLATTLNNLGVNLANQGRYEEAETLLRRSLAMSGEVMGPDHPSTAQDLANLGVLMEIQGDYAAADSALSEALRIRRLRVGTDHYDTAFNLTQLGSVLQRAGELERAEALLREAMEIEARILEPDHRNAGITRVHLAAVLRSRGQEGEAEPLLREAVEILASSLGDDHEFTETVRCHLADVLHASGARTEGEALYRACLGALAELLPPNHDILAGLGSRFGARLRMEGRHAEAEPILLEAYEVLLARFGPEHRDTRDAARRLQELYEDWGRPGDAERYRSGGGG